MVTKRQNQRRACERRTKLLTVRTTPTHYLVFKKAAARCGISMSAWITDRLLSVARSEESEAAR